MPVWTSSVLADGLGNGRQVPAQADRARQPAAGGDQEQERATDSKSEAMPLVATEEATGNHHTQQQALAQHPEPAALQKIAAHACRIAQEGNNRSGRRSTGSVPAGFDRAVQNQAAGLGARFLPAIAESQLVAEAGARRKDILVVLVQHEFIIVLSIALCEPCL